MKSFVAIVVLVAVVAADVSHVINNEAAAQIVKQLADVAPDGFSFAYETSNGISAQESGVLKNAGREDAAIEVQGSNQFTAPDGTTYQLSYVANENGFQPQGAHLPTPPPAQEIPEYIVRSLEYIRTHPPAPEPSKKF